MIGRGRRGVAVAMGMALAQAACQHLSLPTPPGSAEPAPAAAQPVPAPTPTDPVLIFVTQAAPGQATTLDDPALGRIQVRLEREYYSADAVVCRRFTLTVRQDIQTRVACREPNGWQLDAVLGRGPTH